MFGAKKKPLPQIKIERVDFSQADAGYLITRLEDVRKFLLDQEQVSRNYEIRAQILNEGISTIEEIQRRMRAKLAQKGKYDANQSHH
jgi:hypothetical protein